MKHLSVKAIQKTTKAKNVALDIPQIDAGAQRVRRSGESEIIIVDNRGKQNDR